jgi:DNA-binding CsgD family transcriptional regulator
MGYNDLTEQEKTVARMISNGYSHKEIAKYLGMTIGSLDWTVQLIMRKLECNKNTAIAKITVLHEMKDSNR